LGTLLVGLIGILVAGAIIRTVDKTENVAEARGQGQGRGVGEGNGYEEQQTGWNTSSDTERKGRGGNGQEVDAFVRQYPNYESTPEEWVLIDGVVAQAPAVGVDLTVKTGDGQEIAVGTGPGYMEAQGFTLQAGEQVQVQGYWEDDELKAAQVTRLPDGQTITLRDQDGRPRWAGSGKRANEQQATLPQGGQGQGGAGRGQGQGGRGQGQGQGALGEGRAGRGQGQGAYGGGDDGILPGGGDLGEEEAEALREALADEYKAWSVYDQVIADFGAVRPFTNIQRAEENHIAALLRLFDAYGLDAPANEWPGNVPAFDTLAEACAAGVQAEIDNADLYDSFSGAVDNPDIVRVFAALQRASQEQHLPAFQRCAP
jgi:hypothetical protein